MSDNVVPANVDTCLVEFNKKEYAIVGDALFANTVEEVPQWFQKLIQDKVLQINGPMYDILAQYNLSLLAALQGLDIAKNTYEQYIYKVITDSEAYVASLTTLNSTIANNDASIRQLLTTYTNELGLAISTVASTLNSRVDHTNAAINNIQTTYATQDYVAATASQLLSASLNGGAIGARISSAESAMATQYGAMAQRLQTLESTFDDVSGQQSANASAIQALTTYTGYGVYNGADALIANSSFKTDLDAYLAGTDYNIGGSSTLIQDVNAVSTDKMKQVEAKFEYGSTIEINGITYNAGFGLVNAGTKLPDGITQDSQFWVKADKFRLVDPNGGTSSPFTVSNGTTYIQNAVIGWDGVTGTNKPQDGATRNVNRGTWSPGTQYYVGDIVQYNGSSYTNNIATNSINPTNTSYWTLLASQGISGRAVSLVAANGGVFTYNSAGLVPSPTSTVVTATAVNTTGTVYYEFFVNDVSVQNTTSNTYTVTAPNSLGNSKIEVQIREGTSTGTVLTRDQLTIVGIKPGVNAFTVVLTNEAHTLPVNNGVVTYTGSGTTIKVYEGSTQLAYGTTGNGTFSVTAVGSGISVGTNTNGVFSDHSNMTANNATITYTVTVRSSTGVVSTLTKIQSLAKSLQGIPGNGGENARAVNLTTTSQVFTYNSAGATPSPTTATLTATAINTVGTVYYEFFVNDVSKQNSTSSSYVLTAPASMANTKVEVQIREGSTTGTVVARDQLTVVGVRPGVNSITVLLTNEAHTLPTTSDGVVTYTGSGTAVKAYEGTAQLTYGTSGNSTYSVTAAVTTGTVTIGTNTNGVFANHSEMTTNNATITYTVTVRSSTGAVSTYTKVQSLAKSVQGQPGNKGGTGDRGAAVISYAANLMSTTIADATSRAGTYFSNGGGPSPAINGDTLLLTNTNASSGWTNLYKYNGTSWVNSTVLRVDGDAVVKGTLSSDRIVSGKNPMYGNANYYFGLNATSTVKNTDNQVLPAAVLGEDHTTQAGSGNGGVFHSSWNSGVVGGCYSTGFAAGAFYRSGASDSYSSIARGVELCTPMYAGYFSGDVHVAGKGHFDTTSGYGVYGGSQTSHGVYGASNNSLSYGVYTPGKMYAGGGIQSPSTVQSFTGAHIAFAPTGYAVGDIVSTTSAKVDTVEQAVIAVEPTSVSRCKKVLGVVSSSEPNVKDMFTAEVEESLTNWMYENELYSIGVNAVGEGAINVCDLNGDIDSGDYICSSTVKGKGVKQDDDLHHNYTAAKALESVIWANEVVGINGCFEYEGRKCKMISCTYHCG